MVGVTNTDALEENIAVGANPLAAGTVKTAINSNANTIGPDILKPRPKFLTELIFLFFPFANSIVAYFQSLGHVYLLDRKSDCIEVEVMNKICKAFVSPFFLSF